MIDEEKRERRRRRILDNAEKRKQFILRATDVPIVSSRGEDAAETEFEVENRHEEIFAKLVESEHLDEDLKVYHNPPLRSNAPLENPPDLNNSSRRLLFFMLGLTVRLVLHTELGSSILYSSALIPFYLIEVSAFLVSTKSVDSIVSESQAFNLFYLIDFLLGGCETGGYMSAKKSKLADQFKAQKNGDSTEDKKGIFHQVSIFVNGYTQPNADELKRLMIIHDGNYHHYYSLSRTTHIIASNLPYAKIRKLQGEKIVRPEWITDSIKEGRLLDWAKYQLYPNLVQKNVLKFADGKDSKNVAVDAEENIANIKCQDLPTKAELSDEDLFDDDSNYAFTACDQRSADNGASHENLEKSEPETENSEIQEQNPHSTNARTLLSKFYGRSRLHHISTMGTYFKDYVAELHAKGDTSFPGVSDLLKSCPGTSNELGFKKPRKRVVMHIDMDCFFVSVGLKKRPELRGKPVVVTHSRATGGVRPRGQKIEEEFGLRIERRAAKNVKAKQKLVQDAPGFEDFEERTDETSVSSEHPKYLLDDQSSTAEVSSCSYEARAKGVRNGMYLGEAVKLCPDLFPIPYDFEGYTEVSKILYDTVARYTHAIEAVSCDEMFVDCTDILSNTGVTCLEFAKKLREEIQQKTSCTASAGLGQNMLIARLATRLAKPNGQFYVEDDEACEFMKDQTVRDLPGVGRSTSLRIEEKFSATTCGELQVVPLAALKSEFGPKLGSKLHNFSRGVDDRVVMSCQARKSVSAAMNYAIRFTSHQESEEFLRELSRELASRMERISVKCSSLTLKLEVRAPGAPVEPVKYMGIGVCDSLSRQVKLPQSTRDPVAIFREAWKLYNALNIVVSDLRGVGLQATKLEGHSSNVQARVVTNANQPTLSGYWKPKSEIVRAAVDAPKIESLLSSPRRLHKECDSPRGSPGKFLQDISPFRSPTKGRSPKGTPVKNRSPRAKAERGARTATLGKNQTDIRSAFDLKQKPSDVFRVHPSNSGNTVRVANINGIRETNEVKVLLREWVESCGSDPPLDEDYQVFANFLADLCYEYDLVAVEIILKHFRRLLCDGRGKPAMKEAYLTLAGSIKMSKESDVNERCQKCSLFEKNRACGILTGLSLAVSLSLQDRRKLGISLEEDEPQRKCSKEEDVPPMNCVTDGCSVCGVLFDSISNWRQHLKLDWHLYNVKRKAKGLAIVSADEFEKNEEKDDDVSSVSGSSSEESDVEEPSSRKSTRRGDIVLKRIREQPVVFFKNTAGQVILIHRALLQSSQQSETDVVKNAEQLCETLNLAIILVSGGHFAAAIFRGKEMVAHKTFHSYTVRAKQGRTQGAADSKSGTSQPKSAGASLRRYNAQTFKMHIEKFVIAWAEQLDKCDKIFYRVPARNQGVMFSSTVGYPLRRDDPRMRIVPISVSRPTLSEVKRVHDAITTLRFYDSPPSFIEKLSKPPEKKIKAGASSAKEKKEVQASLPAEEQADSEVTQLIEKLDGEFFAPSKEEPLPVKKQKKKKPCQVESVESVPVDLNPVPKGVARDFMKSLCRAVKADDEAAFKDCGEIPKELLNYLELDVGNPSAWQMVVNLPVEDGSTYLLHTAAARENGPCVEMLLEIGADPCMKDNRDRVPYQVAVDKESRNAFRRFMGTHPERFDWSNARVPSALTDDLEKQQAAKKAERRKAQKEIKKEKDRVLKAEAEARREEEAERLRFLALSEREKVCYSLANPGVVTRLGRALAAERRILAGQQSANKTPVLVRCHLCGLDISGKVPFVAFDLQFCSPDCVKQFRNQTTRPC
ncbi:unnamed protein product [Notodromas monacha]|uniref:DNA repair protein REV1 n=1 Tax=Notodromas monacha TaxID=399045 RepID=A0A7R9BJJ4_9CRUS|nr:unnamed protein product [Notodromas monacha]CAG0916673.1 unnamed protein product [Notodromas monacha]